MTTVELPAPIGSTIYTTFWHGFNYRVIEEQIITGYVIGEGGVEEVHFRYKNQRPNDPQQFAAPIKLVDFTREDAEKRLEAES